MAKFRPEIEISGRFLVSGQKIHILLAEKNFGQNARIFGLPATSKVKIFEKTPQNAKFEFFQMAKFRPEMEISGRFAISGQKIHTFSAKKILG